MLAQEHHSFELIVVDDASKVPASATVPTLTQDDRVKFEYLPANGGVAAARNRGIELARGDYIAFLDDDDTFRPHKLAQCQLFLDDTRVDVLYHRMQIHFASEGFDYEGAPQPTPFSLEDLLAKNLLGSPSMVVARREALVSVGGFDPALPALEDYELWLKLRLADYQFGFLDSVLTDYVRDTTAMSRSLNLSKDVEAWQMIHERYASHYSRMPAAWWRDHMQKIASYRGFRSLLSYRRLMAARWFLTAAAARPASGAGLAMLAAAALSIVSPAMTLRAQAAFKRLAFFRGVYEPARPRSSRA